MIKNYNNKIHDQEVLAAKDSGQTGNRFYSKAEKNDNSNEVCCLYSVVLIFRPLLS